MSLISKIGKKTPFFVKKWVNIILNLLTWKLINMPHPRRLSEIIFHIKMYIFRRHIIKRYFRNVSSPKIQIGCGSHLLEGWLNGDIAEGDIYIDATKKLPFKDNSFDHIYSEQMLEHLTLSQGKYFINECYRILKPEGVLRISTPDLTKLVQCYLGINPVIDAKTLIKASWPSRDGMSKCEMLNGFMGQGGFRDYIFIYDQDFIISFLKNAKFLNITFCERNKSAHAALRNIEAPHPQFIQHPELYSGITLIVEAQK